MKAESVVWLCPNSLGGIPMRLKGWESLDVGLIASCLKNLNIDVRITEPSELFRLSKKEIHSTVLFSSTSMFGSYRLAFETVILRFESFGGIAVPDSKSYMSYENKVLAMSIAEGAGLSIPHHHLITCKEDVHRILEFCMIPHIWKLPWGSGSRYVHMIRTPDEALSLSKTWLRSPEWGDGTPPSLFSRVKNRLMGTYSGRGVGAILCEEFIQSPGYDWKILVWNDKANALKRWNRKNDFRASGSGNFEEVRCPPAVLELAYDSCKKLGLHWGSFDIIEGPERPLVTEWQAVHFGTVTTDAASICYRRVNENWIIHEHSVVVEEEIAGALASVAALGQ